LSSMELFTTWLRIPVVSHLVTSVANGEVERPVRAARQRPGCQGGSGILLASGGSLARSDGDWPS